MTTLEGRKNWFFAYDEMNNYETGPLMAKTYQRFYIYRWEMIVSGAIIL